MKRFFQPGRFKFGFVFLLVAILVVSLIFTGVLAFGQTATSTVSPTPVMTSTPTATSTTTFSPAATTTPSPTTTVPLQMAFGKVVSVASDNSSFMIQPDNMFQVNVNVNGSTLYTKLALTRTTIASFGDMLEDMLGKGSLSSLNNLFGMGGMPGISGMPDIGMLTALPSAILQAIQPAAFNDIAVGDMVFVRGLADGNLAMQVLIIKLPIFKQVQGTITAVTSSTITITPVNGTAVTLNWDGSTRFILKGLISVTAGLFSNAIYDSSNNALIVTARPPAPTPTPATTASPTTTTSPAVTTSPTSTLNPPATQSPTSPSGSNTTSSPLITASTTSTSAAPTSTPKVISINAATYISQPVQMNTGDTLAITLPSNPSTGFSWKLDSITDAAILMKVSNTLVSPMPSPSVVGAPGTEVWTFKAIGAGASGIFMEYSQAGGAIKGAQVFAISVIVR